jgi:hypothetical protein
MIFAQNACMINVTSRLMIPVETYFYTAIINRLFIQYLVTHMYLYHIQRSKRLWPLLFHDIQKYNLHQLKH